MRDIRVNICGTGAMACVFGAGLSRTAEVTLIGTWREAIEAVSQRGIRIAGAAAQEFNVRAVPFESNPAPAELVIVLVKTWQNNRIARRLSKLLAPGGVALTLQNGLGNQEALGWPMRVGTTTVGAALTGPGVVLPGGDGSTHAAVPSWVIDLLRKAGFEAHGCEESQIERMLWSKLVASCGINALTALLRVCNGEVIRRPDAAQILAAAAVECAAVASAKGIELPFGDPAEHAETVAHRTAGNRSSMLRDIERGAPTEVDAINGAIVRAAEHEGVPAPVNRMLWTLVRAASAVSRGQIQ